MNSVMVYLPYGETRLFRDRQPQFPISITSEYTQILPSCVQNVDEMSDNFLFNSLHTKWEANV